jgi:hypothetical protein
MLPRAVPRQRAAAGGAVIVPLTALVQDALFLMMGSWPSSRGLPSLPVTTLFLCCFCAGGTWFLFPRW